MSWNAKTSCASQLPMMVLAPFSPQRDTSWLVVWHSMVHQVFLLHAGRAMPFFNCGHDATLSIYNLI